MPYFAIILLFVLAGCGGSGSGGGSSSSSGLLAESVSIDDFNVVSTYELTEQQIRERINDESVFYSDKPSSGGISARSECINDLEDLYGTISPSGDYYRYEFQHDMKNCSSDANITKSEMTSEIRSYYSETINGEKTNLSEYTINNNPSSTSGTFLTQYFREKIWNNNNKYYVNFLTSSASNPAIHCSYTSVFNNCEYRYKWVYYYNNDLKTVTGVSLKKFEFKNVTQSGGTYYASGSINFRIENWAGTMTFSGSSTPSTYTAYNGSQTITGTLDPTSTGFADDEIKGLKYWYQI